MVASWSRVTAAATVAVAMIGAAKFAKTDLATARAIRALCVTASWRVMSLLLLLLHSDFVGRLILFGPSARALCLKVEVVFCLDCGVDLGVEYLVGDAARHHTAHFQAQPGK